MVKDTRIYFGLILLLALIVMSSIVTNDFLMTAFSVLGIGLIIYQVRVNEDVKLVITKNKINRAYSKKDLNNYFIVFLEISNLSTYSQFYDIKLSDYIVKETYKLLRKKLHNNVFLYSSDQLVIISEFDNKTVINQLLRTNEQTEKVRKLISFIEHHNFNVNSVNESYHVKITAGTGSVGLRDEIESIQSMIRLAHFTMLNAKENNKPFTIATEQTRIIKDDIDIFNQEIESGIAYDEFVPYFLPIIDSKTTKIVGCESLMRWEKNEYRIIEVGKFKKIAEEKNLFGKLDKIIIEKSFKSYNAWREKGLISDDFIITINLSLQSLITLKSHELLKLSRKYNIDNNCVEFDISEHDISNEEVIESLRRLKQNGYQVSIDAFDTKTTLLKTLINIDIDTIKLGKVNLPTDQTTNGEYQFYRTLIKFAKLLGYNVMSKGIENKKHLETARDLKVNLVQGYYFTPPLNDTKILGFLNKYQSSILD